MQSRVKRNSKNYPKKDRIKVKRKLKKLTLKKVLIIIIKFIIKSIIKLLKILGKNLILLIVGISYEIYLILRWINNLVAKLFMKLPRTIKIITIYLLLLNLILNGYEVYNMFNKHKNELSSIIVSTLNIESIPSNLVVEEETVEECEFDNTSCLIAEIGKKIGMSDEEVLISIAISKWETGNYTSDAFNKLNNVGGMMCNSGLIEYETLEDGITAFVTNLKSNYFEQGLTTLELIQPKYCPIGADNDPNGLNQYWLSGTTKMYNELIKK